MEAKGIGRVVALGGLVLLAACTALPRGEAVEQAGQGAGQGAVSPVEQGAGQQPVLPAAQPPADSAGGTGAGGGAAAGAPAADAAAARLHVPPGFALNTYFTGLRAPRLMAVGPDGSLYVAERGADAVVRLPDADGDGAADARQVVAEGLAGAHSVEWHAGALYAATNGSVVRLADGNGDGDFLDAGEQAVVTDNIPTGGGHTTRTAHFGPDGKLYVAAGSSSNIGVETDRRRAAILRFDAAGSIPADNPFAQDPEATRRPVWAEGLRNSVDFLFLADGRLWADHNGSDGLGDDAPPEEIVIEVAKGRHYGWPYCYTPALGVVPPGTVDVQDTRVAFDQWLGDCGQATPALFTDLAHQAPLGMVQYNAPAGSQGAFPGVFPAEYAGNLFVAYHGSWNSSAPRDCRVQRIVVQDGMPVAGEPFVTGFRESENEQCGGAWGRPAGVAVGAHGELFISDDQNGSIYRVVYTGAAGQ